MSRYLSNLVRTLLVLLLISLCLGCGGGTTGTGDTYNAQVHGLLRKSDGGVISGARITHLETGQSTLTDESGAFELRTEFQSPNPSFLVQGEGIKESTLAVPQIAVGAKDVALDFSLEALSGIVSVASVQVDAQELPPSSSDGGPSSGDNSEGGASQERALVVQGSVRNSRGAGLSGVVVRLRGLDAQGTTDSQGEFHLSTLTSVSRFTLDVLYEGQTGSVVVRDLPSAHGGTVQVSMTITLVLDSSQIDPEHPGGDTPVLSVTASGVKVEVG